MKNELQLIELNSGTFTKSQITNIESEDQENDFLNYFKFQANWPC